MMRIAVKNLVQIMIALIVQILNALVEVPILFMKKMVEIRYAILNVLNIREKVFIENQMGNAFLVLLVMDTIVQMIKDATTLAKFKKLFHQINIMLMKEIIFYLKMVVTIPFINILNMKLQTQIQLYAINHALI